MKKMIKTCWSLRNNNEPWFIARIFGTSSIYFLIPRNTFRRVEIHWEVKFLFEKITSANKRVLSHAKTSLEPVSRIHQSSEVVSYIKNDLTTSAGGRDSEKLRRKWRESIKVENILRASWPNNQPFNHRKIERRLMSSTRNLTGERRRCYSIFCYFESSWKWEAESLIHSRANNVSFSEVANRFREERNPPLNLQRFSIALDKAIWFMKIRVTLLLARRRLASTSHEASIIDILNRTFIIRALIGQRVKLIKTLATTSR